MTLVCFSGLTLCEIKVESTIENYEYIVVDNKEYSTEYNYVLSKYDMEHISDVIAEAEKCLEEYGFDFKTKEYHMDFTIYFPWEGARQKVFIINSNSSCNINFYAESLCEISDEELITRYIYSALDQNTQLQEIAAKLLIADVASQVIYNERSSQISAFSYDSLVESYGYVASPKQCVIAECMKRDPDSFAALYHSLETISNLNEIKIDVLGVSSEYEEIFRRIVE
ncbi:MAG: hypothetical protein NC123_16510 [Butyrivibrio sp.]|nr:hypothetical protein [Acetatifactor muris]MCM1561121.1 hypothetical protein [Butyrivibrio sp.]